MRQDQWATPPVAFGHSQTGPMAIAEILQKFIDNNSGNLDYGEDWAATGKRFNRTISFAADKESLQWLREYISDTLAHKVKDVELRAGLDGASENDKRGGWFKDENWHGWQRHMSGLVSTLDGLIASPDAQIELIQPQEQTHGDGEEFCMEELS